MSLARLDANALAGHPGAELDSGCSTAADADARLATELERLGDLVVAFSGGVDSSVLLHAAHRLLGPRAVGWIADSPSLPRAELAAARAFASEHGVRLVVVATSELDDPDYVANAGARCYFCKRTLFRAMSAWARSNAFAHLAFGEIVDDLADDRPGARAARELAVVAPLAAAGWTKADVRAYARRHGLSTADKPAAACLASRLPVGRTVTAERLARIEAVEADVRALGFRVLRVRDQGEAARVEVGADELARAQELRASLAQRLRGHGFTSFTLAAYRSPTSALSAGRSATRLPTS